MHVVVDGFHLWGPSRDRGIGTYVRTLLAATAEPRDLTITVLSPVSLDLPDGVTCALVPHRPPGPRGFLDHARRVGREARRVGADVLHVPGLPAPVRPGMAWAITVHDAFPLTLPRTSRRRQRALIRLSLPRIRTAPAVVVPSHATAAQLRRLRVPGERIHVIPNGIDLAAFDPDGPARRVSAPYVVTSSSPDPRKQRDIALRVMRTVVDAGLPHRLALVGRLTADEEQDLWAAGSAVGVGKRMDVLGFVPDMAAVLRGADASLLPSAGEGFGYPAVEAMATGTPVIAFDNSATREVADGVATLVSDGDTPALANALIEVLTDSDLRERVSHLGRARAASYGLASFGDGLETLWRRLANSSR